MHMYCSHTSILPALHQAVWEACMGLMSACSGGAEEGWRAHFRSGQRALVLVGDERPVLEVEAAAAAAKAAGCSVHFARRSKQQQDLSGYDAVVLEGGLAGLPRAPARACLLQLCGDLGVGAALVVRDDAMLPASIVLGLLRLLLIELPLRLLALLLGDAPRPPAPHDIVPWLPPDVRLESRRPLGLLREAVVLRKLAASPHGAVDRLRRAHGSSSMAYCACPAANRVGRPEALIRFFLYEAATGDSSSEALGYVAYTEHTILGARLRLVVMDPVGPAAHLEATLAAFLEDCRAAGARPVFSCVGPAAAAPLRRLGFHTTKLGGEIAIPLAEFRLPKERCRYVRAAAAKGLECFPECYDYEELLELNAEWVKGKGMGSEIGIWTYPPSMPSENSAAAAAGEVRRLFTYQDGKLVGFVCVEPFYRGDGSGEILGYGLNTIRFVIGDAPSWASDFTIATMTQSLQAEGKARYLAFGLSPFTDLRAGDGELRWLRCLFQALWAANVESFYSVRGLAKKKQHHCAKQGVPLEDRFISGVPFYAFPDFVRFTVLLFGVENLWRIPGGLCLLLWTQACRLSHRMRTWCVSHSKGSLERRRK